MNHKRISLVPFQPIPVGGRGYMVTITLAVSPGPNDHVKHRIKVKDGNLTKFVEAKPIGSQVVLISGLDSLN